MILQGCYNQTFTDIWLFVWQAISLESKGFHVCLVKTAQTLHVDSESNLVFERILVLFAQLNHNLDIACAGRK